MLKAAVQQIIPDISELRHDLHAQPELALEEHKTAQLIRRHLKSLEMELFPSYLGTDVVALLRGKAFGKHVVLRAEMDALPLPEKNQLPYRSTAKGYMHACGHDGHMAILVGVARILAKLRSEFKGSVKFIFQPGEEVIGAGRQLVAEGALEKPVPDAVLALHAWPGLPVGMITTKSGPIMAAADFFKIKLIGPGGHGSQKVRGGNPILTAGQIINDLDNLTKREFSYQEPVTLNLCKIQGGTHANILPGEAVLEGSVRYFSETVLQRMPQLFKQVVKRAGKAEGTTAAIDYQQTYKVTCNNDDIVQRCKEVIRERLTPPGFQELAAPVMASEDFSFYLEQYPGALFFLGMGQGGPALHSSRFDFNDQALYHGIIFLVHATLELLTG